MQIIVATDIHGVHDPLRAQLAVLGQTTIISPWIGDGQPFASEQEAVAEFHRQDGLSSFEKKIAEAVNGEPALLIGFSVGATALWRYVVSQQCNAESQAVLYYGSRIRDCTALVPRCPTSLCFAEHEPSFNPESVATEVSESGALCTVLKGTHHGFMNPASKHYRPDLAAEHFQMILRRVSTRSARTAS